jgi:hypothetical protein
MTKKQLNVKLLYSVLKNLRHKYPNCRISYIDIKPNKMGANVIYVVNGEKLTFGYSTLHHTEEVYRNLTKSIVSTACDLIEKKGY